jgi:hypothetical protein
VMGDRNTLAKVALGVLKAIHNRLKKALLPIPGSASAGESFSSSMCMAPNVNLSSIAPPQPKNGLLYNDLYTIGEGGPFDPNATCGTEMWQFNGDFRDDIFWGFMDDYKFLILGARISGCRNLYRDAISEQQGVLNSSLLNFIEAKPYYNESRALGSGKLSAPCSEPTYCPRIDYPVAQWARRLRER